MQILNRGKQKHSAGLNFSHTAAVLLSTSSLQQTRLPLLQLICEKESEAFGVAETQL